MKFQVSSCRRSIASRLRGAWLCASAVCLTAILTPVVAVQAAPVSTLSASYYTVSSADPDFGNQCCGTFADLVKNTLGPDGLPVYNPATSDSFTIHDLNGSGEITWWDPTFNSNVTASGSGSISLPFNDGAMYPPTGQNPGGNDSNGYLAGVFTGAFSLNAPQQVQFGLGADDDAFLYVDGMLVDSLGGVHADTQLPITTPQTLATGNHTITLFYDDRYPTQAALSFSILSQGVTITPPLTPPCTVPLPPAVWFLGSGLLGLAAVGRRRAFGG